MGLPGVEKKKKLSKKLTQCAEMLTLIIHVHCDCDTLP